MIWSHVGAGVLAAFIAAAGIWQVQNWRYGEIINKSKTEQAEAQVVAVDKARKDEQKFQDTKDVALKSAQTRAAKLAVVNFNLDTVIGRLRGDLEASRVELSKATGDSVLARAEVLTELLGACTAEYRDLGKEAASLASDKQTLIEAWPSQAKPLITVESD